MERTSEQKRLDDELANNPWVQEQARNMIEEHKRELHGGGQSSCLRCGREFRPSAYGYLVCTRCCPYLDRPWRMEYGSQPCYTTSYAGHTFTVVEAAFGRWEGFILGGLLVSPITSELVESRREAQEWCERYFLYNY